jgi:hypothetical protein
MHVCIPDDRYHNVNEKQIQVILYVVTADCTNQNNYEQGGE